MDGTASLAGVPELIRRLAELNEVGIALSQEKDLGRLLETILVAAKQITRADGAHFTGVMLATRTRCILRSSAPIRSGSPWAGRRA